MQERESRRRYLFKHLSVPWYLADQRPLQLTTVLRAGIGLFCASIDRSQVKTLQTPSMSSTYLGKQLSSSTSVQLTVGRLEPMLFRASWLKYKQSGRRVYVANR